MSDVAQVLRDARALIERGWCQEEGARNRHGEATLYSLSEAVEWCPITAVLRSTDDYPLALDIMDLLRQVVEYGSLQTWNDNPKRTKEEVLAAFDEAIRRAEG